MYVLPVDFLTDEERVRLLDDVDLLPSETLIGIFTKHLQDINSSKKSDNILNTSINTEAKVTDLQKQNKKLVKEASELTYKVDRQGYTIDNLRKENAELYAKLANSSLDIYHNLTGGDSYCTLTIGNMDASKTIGYLVFTLGEKINILYVV